MLAPVPIYLGLKNPEETSVVSISAGRAHLAIVTDLEGIFTLGSNAYGQCGRTIIENEKYSGSRIVHRIPNFSNDKIISVECGQDHTLVFAITSNAIAYQVITLLSVVDFYFRLFLTENGKVYSCGWGADGQTGLGHYNCESLPKRVLGDLENEKIVKLSSKSDCVLAVSGL